MFCPLIYTPVTLIPENTRLHGARRILNTNIQNRENTTILLTFPGLLNKYSFSDDIILCREMVSLKFCL